MASSAQFFVDKVRSALGDPYVYGDTGPKAFDCSGLVMWAAHLAGVSGMPRTSEQQYAFVQHISRKQLQPGDLVFSQWPGDNASPGHVQVYVGGGKVIGADTTDVQEVPLSSNRGHIVGYGRIPGLKGSATAAAGGAPGGGGFSLLSLALPGDVLGLFSTGEEILNKLMWIFNPENWARIIAGLLGGLLLLFGLGFLVAAGA